MQLFNVDDNVSAVQHAIATLKSWEEPGDEAILLCHSITFCSFVQIYNEREAHFISANKLTTKINY